MEFDETFEQCAVRETLEETGLEIEDVRFLTALETFWTYKGQRFHYVTIFMTAFAKAGDDGKEAELKVRGPNVLHLAWWRTMSDILYS